MTASDLQTAALSIRLAERPLDSELDLFGLTHRGNVRRENQDHFLLATVHQQVVVHATSLPAADGLPLRGERLATILLVADGVGGGAAGSEASRVAVETITRYVSSTLRSYHAAGTVDEGELLSMLRAAALEAHAAVLADAAANPSHGGMATTLTLALAVWPWAYVVQVGDSRCYHYCDGALHQITRDQTVAQDLVDKGILKAEQASASPLGSVLASAIGGGAATPEVSRLDIHERGCVILLCSDGLTKHVTDAEIAERVGAMRSAEQLCRSLLALALERGGSDNVTILAGRALAAEP
ncbi:MAG: protein phosphatase 2C domain-containing protein [Gemmatimonadales bacterium]|jgi:protein phosphatase